VDFIFKTSDLIKFKIFFIESLNYSEIKMKSSKEDHFHGLALTKIIKYESFKALNRASKEYGHYQMNHDTKLHIKYASSCKPQHKFQFVLNDSDLKRINKDIESESKAYICLVCGTQTICPINKTEIKEIIDLSSKTSQSIYVTAEPGKSLWVSGSTGRLKTSIPHNAFPSKIFN
jgi:uncharacterized protein with PIN domain